jgi:endogenous inhibitor of DNA gyrase (YacG/DUF329 family)
MDVSEVQCPYCGSSNVGLVSLFEPLSALVDQDEVAQKQCPACSKTYTIEREVSVNYQVLAEAHASYV